MRKNIYIAIILLLFSSLCWANLSKTSAELERLRLRAESTQTKTDELAYLNAFPKTFGQFKFTFYGRDLNELGELYDKHEAHLILLDRLSKKYPDKVLSIWLSVARNGIWDADAIGILQHQLITYAANNTKHFAQELLKTPQEQQLSIIKFLADVENHEAYDEYKKTLEHLKDLGYQDLFERFRKAKIERQKRNH